MKVLLVLSLIANLILGYTLISQRSETPVVQERLIIETHRTPAPVQKRDIKEVRGHLLPKIETKKTVLVPNEKWTEAPPEYEEYQTVIDTVENDKRSFLVDELGLDESKLADFERLKEAYYKEIAKITDKNELELPIETKRRLLDAEEKFHLNAGRLIGQKEWERYQKFRKNYNERGINASGAENRTFIFMGP